MKTVTIQTGRLKPVLIYKKRCPYCRSQFPTGRSTRITCGQSKCKTRHGLAYSRRPKIKARVAEYQSQPAIREKRRKDMLNRYYALIMLKELEHIAFSRRV